MTPATEQQYSKLANHFVRTRLHGKQVTPKALTDALINCAGDYRPAYWRRLRKALELEQREAGYDKAADRIAATQNPLTTGPGAKTRRKEVPRKQRRVKTVDFGEVKQIIASVEGDRPLEAALVIAHRLGCRPAEMLGIEVHGTAIHIKGAKSRADRGIDRIVHVSDDDAALIKECMYLLRREGGDKPMSRIQARLNRATKKLWPRRKHRISLYSFRHQLGADLKASGLDCREVAAIMGHLSTASVEVYGDSRQSGRAGSRSLRADPGSVAKVKLAAAPSPPSLTAANAAPGRFSPSAGSGLTL